MPQPARMKYVEDSDELVIEDETERVALTGNIPVGTSVTGIFLACQLITLRILDQYKNLECLVGISLSAL